MPLFTDDQAAACPSNTHGREPHMTQDIRHHLQRHFGFSEPRPGQEAVIRHLLDGESAAAVFPTGGGKSLC